jgi:sugar lactone lactonase YvrE
MYSIIKNKDILGESPIWNHFNNKLYWIDIISKKIKCFDDSSYQTFNLQKMPTCLALIDSNQIFCSVENGLGIYDFRNNKYNYLLKINDSKVRFNDGKVDRNGILYIGTMDRNEKEKIGSIYMLQNELVKIRDNIGITNGIAFSKDNKSMYYSDSLDKTIFKKNNKFEEEIVKIYNTEAPDGATIDSNDNYYSCLWGGHRIDIYNPNNNLMDNITLDAKYPTCCCFGGNNNDMLFITTSSLLRNSKSDGLVYCKKYNHSIGISEVPILI